MQYGDSLLKGMSFMVKHVQQNCIPIIIMVTEVKIELPDDNSEWEW